ncbi:pilus assembly protein PilM [Candidatus Mycalebacterium sp.]
MKILSWNGIWGGSIEGFFAKFFRDENAVGIDIGSYSTKVVVLKNSSGSETGTPLHVRESFQDSGVFKDKEIEDFDSVCSGLLSLRDDFGLKGARAAVGVSGCAVFTSKLKISPSADAKAAEDAVLLHLSKFFSEGLDGCRHSFYRDPQSPEDVLVTVAREDAARDYVSALRSSGFVPTVVDYDGFALINSYNRRAPSSDGLTVLLNIGHSVTNLAVLKDGKTVFTRDLSTASGELTLEIARAGNLAVDDAEAEKISLGAGSRREFLSAAADFSSAILREVKSNLEMFCDCGNEKPGKVILSGGGSLLHGLRETVAETLGVDAEYADPLRAGRNGNEFPDGLSAKSAVAFGLALRMTERAA